MSGFFGIFNRNGKPVDKKIAEDMLKVMSAWEPDEQNIWIDGSVAFGHTMLWNTPESKYEHLPLQEDAYVLTMDARIDNRDELANEIELPDRPLSQIGDSEFILGAYKKWGEECPKYLLGDFAFAIWDEQKQHLFCARDHVGIKPLFYFQSDKLFVISNDISVMLKHPQIPQVFDDITLAYFVKDEGIDLKDNTFFENIKKLRPATSLIISEQDKRENIYWKIEDSPPIKYENFQDYVNKLRELFDEAVKVRLRSDYMIASHLSGGIDSSSIAVLSSRNLTNQGKPLYVFNWIDIPKDREKYEFEAWNFSRRIAKLEDNIIHEEFSIDASFLVNQYETYNIFTQSVLYMWEEYYIQDRLKTINARVMLSGWGGDELISYNGYSYISELFRRKKIFSGLYHLFQDKKYNFLSWKELLIFLAKSMLSDTVYKKLRNAIRPNTKSRVTVKVDEDKFLLSSFAEFVESQPDIKNPSMLGVRKRQLELYNLGHIQTRTESWALSGNSRGIDYRYPLLDKRIIEFSIGIPEELFYHWKGKERRLFKTAVSNLLPFDIVWFNKPCETKVNRAFKERYLESLLLLKKNLMDKTLDAGDNNYFNYGKINESILNIEYKKLGYIIYGILYLNSKRMLQKENK